MRFPLLFRLDCTTNGATVHLYESSAMYSTLDFSPSLADNIAFSVRYFYLSMTFEGTKSEEKYPTNERRNGSYPMNAQSVFWAELRN